MTVRTPQLTGDAKGDAPKVQRFAEDVVRALNLLGGFAMELRTMDWAEDGEDKAVLTTLQAPVLCTAQARDKTSGSTTVATGSVSFHVTGFDAGSGQTEVAVTDISGLSSGTDYVVTLLFVGEV